MAKDTHSISVGIPAEYNLTAKQEEALRKVIKVQLAAVKMNTQAKNLLSLPETNIFLRKPRQPQGAASAKKKAGGKSSKKK